MPPDYSRRSAFQFGATLSSMALAGCSSYDSDIRVENRQLASIGFHLTLTDLDENKIVLDQSITLASEEEFRRQGVFADDTRYRVQVQANGDSAVKEFETCCRGYRVDVYMEQEKLQITTTHCD